MVTKEKHDYNVSYYAKHRDKLLARTKRWNHSHPERVKAGNDKNNARRTRAYSAEAARKNHQKVKRLAMEAYGGKCSCCGESDLRFLTIDHEHNDGTRDPRLYQTLKNEGYPKDRGLRVHCYNCNMGRRSTIQRLCPHLVPLEPDTPHV